MQTLAGRKSGERCIQIDRISSDLHSYRVCPRYLMSGSSPVIYARLHLSAEAMT
jgi:hypothetical protein